MTSKTAHFLTVVAVLLVIFFNISILLVLEQSVT